MTLVSPPPAAGDVPAADLPVSHAYTAAQLQLQLWRPTSTAVVVHVAGELDGSNAGRLHELLVPRLNSTAEALVLDLSQVTFFGVAGLELLAHTHRRAAHRAMTLRVVDGPVCVDRALRATGWAEPVPTYPRLQDALADLTGRDRGRARHATT